MSKMPDLFDCLGLPGSEPRSGREPRARAVKHERLLIPSVFQVRTTFPHHFGQEGSELAHVFPGEKGSGTCVPSRFRQDLMVFELHPGVR